jgi:hypothetical protein
MLQEMHCFQGKGPVICQKGPLQVQANFHFFCFDVASTHVQHFEHTGIYLHSALICIARQGRTCAQVTACGMAS